MRHDDFGDLPTWLVRRAARRAPPGLAARLEEEWLADLAARRGLARRVRFGLACCWAGRIITHEHGAACTAAAGAPSGHRLLVLVRFEPPRWSRRTVVVVAVICVHVLLIYALATGLAQRVAAIIPSSLHSSLMTEPQTREEPPPLPSPRFVAPRVDVPNPVVSFNVPEEPGAISVSPPRHEGPAGAAASPPTAPRAVARVLGGPGAGFPDTDDYYPAIARRLEEEGTTIVQVCVNAAGRLTEAPIMVRSSGRARIDAGAINLAKAGSGHYRPTTDDGRPVSSCFAFRVTFRLRN